MEFRDVVAKRRMARSFADRPLPADVLDRIVARAGGHLVVIGDPGRFWDHVAEPEWRANPDWPGLLRAPVIVLPLAGPEAESLIEASFSAMVILLSAVDAGAGALFFAIRRGQAELLAALDIPDGFRPIGAIALGWPDHQDRPSTSAARPRRPAESVIHRRARHGEGRESNRPGGHHAPRPELQA